MLTGDESSFDGCVASKPPEGAGTAEAMARLVRAGVEGKLQENGEEGRGTEDAEDGREAAAAPCNALLSGKLTTTATNTFEERQDPLTFKNSR